MAAGRPSKYDPKYCGEAIQFLAQGYSIGGFAGSIPVAKSTIYEWMEAHPEFSDAVKTGQAAAQVFWERRAIEQSETGEGNATLVIFGLKNRARDDWSDISRTEITGKDGGAVEMTGAEKLAAFLDTVAERR